MLPPITAVMILTWLLVLALGGLALSPRFRGAWGLAVGVVGVVAAAVSGILVLPGDLLHLPEWTGLDGAVALLIAWALFSFAASAAPAPRLPGPAWLAAPLAGLLMGLGAAPAMLSRRARDPRGGARLVLASVGGAMIGRIGGPGPLLLGDRDPRVILWLAPVGILLALLARPRSADLPVQAGGSWATTGVLGAVALLALLPGAALPVLLVGTAVLAWMAGLARLQLAPRGLLAWTLGAVLVGLVFTAGSGPFLMAAQLEKGRFLVGGQIPLLLAGAALVTALISGGPVTALIAVAFLDRALALDLPSAAPALAAGIAVGALDPRVLSDRLSQSWGGWLVQVLVVLAFFALIQPVV